MEIRIANEMEGYLIHGLEYSGHYGIESGFCIILEHDRRRPNFM